MNITFIKNKKSRNTIIISIIMVIIIIASFIYYFHNSIVLPANLVDNNETNLIYQVDSIENADGKLKIKGWCFLPDEDTSIVKTLPKLRIILVDADDNSILKYFNAEYGLPRPEVNEYFNNGFDYTNCGFEAQIDIVDLDLENTVYEIAIQQNERVAESVKTGIYYYNNSLNYVNPKIFTPIDAEGTDLQNIIENGILRVYRPDCGTYVYQIGSKLYWILDDNNRLGESAGYMDYMLQTTQLDKLPAERVEKGFSFDNLGWYFEDTEILDMNFGQYRVSVRDIPDDYAVTVITTGFYYGREWVWNSRFFPRYDF